MTPYSDFLWNHLPPRIAMVALILSYTTVLLSIMMFIDSGPTEMIYLDLGQHQ